MKFNRVFFFVLLGSLALLLSGCGAPPATNWPGMSTDGKTIFLASGQHVYNVQLTNGTEVTTTVEGKSAPLRFPLKADGNMNFYAPPAVTPNGGVIVGNAAQSNHALYNVDFATGMVKWTYEKAQKPWVAGALTLDEAVFIPAGDGKLYSFTHNGEWRWEKELSKHSLWTQPITDGEQIYVATIDHKIFSLNPQNGNENWTVELDNGMVGHPALVDGVLYVGTLSGKLYALNAADGSQVWDTPTMLNGNIWGTPAVDADVVYIGTVFGTAGKFYAVDAKTGSVIWSHDDPGSIVAGPLALPDQVIYVTELGHVQSLKKDGTANWNADYPKNKIYTSPLLAGDLIIIAPMGSEFLLAAYDQNGAQKWTFIPAK